MLERAREARTGGVAGRGRCLTRDLILGSWDHNLSEGRHLMDWAAQASPKREIFSNQMGWYQSKCNMVKIFTTIQANQSTLFSMVNIEGKWAVKRYSYLSQPVRYKKEAGRVPALPFTHNRRTPPSPCQWRLNLSPAQDGTPPSHVSGVRECQLKQGLNMI